MSKATAIEVSSSTVSKGDLCPSEPSDHAGYETFIRYRSGDAPMTIAILLPAIRFAAKMRTRLAAQPYNNSLDRLPVELTPAERRKIFEIAVFGIQQQIKAALDAGEDVTRSVGSTAVEQALAFVGIANHAVKPLRGQSGSLAGIPRQTTVALAEIYAFGVELSQRCLPVNKNLYGMPLPTEHISTSVANFLHVAAWARNTKSQADAAPTPVQKRGSALAA